MTTYNQNVAQNVCGPLPVTIPVNIDCSLCAIGFPQAGGMIGINFFGPRCIAGADPSPSYWLGFNTKMAQWKCPNPGQDAEPEPNTWVATGFFGGASSGGCSNQYRFDATLVALNSSQISISVSVKVLAQTAGVWSWQSYMSWSETLTEIVNADTTRYRGRAFASPDFISVTPSSVGGTGDPVSFVKTIVGLTSMRSGCGSVNNAVPDVCGFWDGTQWLSCLRGMVLSTGSTTIRGFTQFGFNTPTCNTLDSCGCDRIILSSVSPPVGTCVYNSNAFATTYGVLGLPGGVESVGAIQQVQYAPAVAGINIIVKQVNGGTIYICTNDNGAGWVISAATVSQAKGPRILTASRTGFDVYLYSLNFPNDNLLADSCSTGGQYPTPGAGDPYWCTPSGCVQSPLQPADAYGGPYSTSGACATACAGLTPPNPPYWCVSQVCVQSSTPPEGYTGGPYASLALCQAASCEPAPPSGDYWCLYGNCVQSATQPDSSATGPYASAAICAENCTGPVQMVWRCTDNGCGTLTRSGAIMSGYTYYLTESACNLSCPTQFWCIDNTCAEFWTGYTPTSYSAGPFSTLEGCYSECDTGAGWYCLSGTCGSYPSRPPGATGPRSGSYLECQPNCFVLEGFEGTMPPQEEEPIPVVAYGGKPVASSGLVKHITNKQMERIKLPCIHRGERLASGFT